MRYLALACDYDGTIATAGVVDAPTLAALERLRASGRKLILVTGRELDDLCRVFPHITLQKRLSLPCSSAALCRCRADG
jgi:HAD superfamily hydrolase (TIGR01484 family)